MNTETLLESLTLGDLEYLEDHGIDIELMQTWDQKLPHAKHLIQVFYVIRRKQDPAVTLDDIRAIPMSQLESLLPTDPPSPAPTSWTTEPEIWPGS